MPLNANGQLIDSFEPKTSKNGDLTQYGQITVRQFTSCTGTIGWDINRASAVIVDGQHRFSALRALLDGNLQDTTKWDADLDQTTLPIQMLIPDSRLGFVNHSGSILHAVRKVFVDLNRHAEPVSEARSILLDDGDLNCVLTRVLFERKVERRPTQTSMEEPTRLQLSLVDWYTEQSKVDKGIHLTTVLTLHSIVKDLLALPTYDPRDGQTCEKFIQRLGDLLSGAPEHQLLESVSDHLRFCEQQELAFHVPATLIPSISNWFSRVWAGAIVQVFTKTEPYAQYLAKLRAHGVLDGPLGVWAAMDSEGKASFEHETSNNYQEIVADIERNKTSSLFFQVVFQKALFQALFALAAGELQGPDDAAKHLIAMFNARLASIPRSFWVGAGLKSDGTIAWSKSSQNAIKAAIMVAILAPLSEWIASSDPTQAALGWTSELCDGVVDTKKRTNAITRTVYTQAKIWREAIKKSLRTSKRVMGQSDYVSTEEANQALAEKILLLLRVVHTLAGNECI